MYCFGCKLFRPGVTTVNKVQEQLAQSPEITEVSRRKVKIPDDATPFLNDKANSYLATYSLLNFKSRFLYSQERELLIYRVFDDGEIVYWNGRYLGNNKLTQRYASEGNKAKLHILQNYDRADTLVLVEDIFSGLKVSQNNVGCDVGVLFGAAIDPDKIWSLDYKKIIIWLDLDKAGEAVKMSNLLKLKFETTCKFSAYDPKFYEVFTINTLLTSRQEGSFN